MSRRNSGYFVSHPVSFFNHRSHIIETFLREIKWAARKNSKYFLGRDDASVIPARRSHTAAGILPARKISHL